MVGVSCNVFQSFFFSKIKTKMKILFLDSVSKFKYAFGNISWKLDSEYENVKNTSGIILQVKITGLNFFFLVEIDLH